MRGEGTAAEGGSAATGNDLRLTVLGCSGGYPGPGSPCSGYLLEAAGRRVWVDRAGGPGRAAAALLLADLDALWISHLHPDHCTDLPLAYHVLAVGGVRGGRRLPVLGPTGWSRRMDAFVDRPGAMAKVFDVVELSDGERVAFADLSLVAFATVHGIEIYTGRAPRGPALAQPEQAGEFAETGGARGLALTHLPPGADPGRARSLAAGSFGGEVEVASMGRVFDLGRPALGESDTGQGG